MKDENDEKKMKDQAFPDVDVGTKWSFMEIISLQSMTYIFIIDTSAVVSGDCFFHTILGIRLHIQGLGPLQAL